MDRLINEKAVLKILDDYYRAFFLNNKWFIDMVNAIKAIPSADKWIPTSDRLPNVGQWVLVTTKDYQKYVEVMCYQGIRIGQHNVGNGWEEYEYPSWTSGHGDILGSHPEAWMPLPKSWKGKQK